MEIDGDRLVNEVAIKNVDATPDGGYALRILQAYRQECDARWADATSGEPPTNLLLIAMNDAQDKRAAELDRAIAWLQSQGNVTHCEGADLEELTR